MQSKPKRAAAAAVWRQWFDWRAPALMSIGIYSSPAWPNDDIQLPTELGEAIYSGRRMHITYVDAGGERTSRWITPMQVLGLSDYIYLQAFCHLREAERSFRLDRILDVSVEV